MKLYNLRADIGEKHDLAAKQPEKVKELHGMLKAWREKVSAPVPSMLNPGYRPEDASPMGSEQ